MEKSTRDFVMEDDLQHVLDYLEDEKSNWQGATGSEDYDPELEPDHVYHVIRALKVWLWEETFAGKAEDFED
jgi:hypothetical protein